MKATVPYVQQKFAEFNELCFGGTLQPIPIKLSNAKTFLGKLSYKRHKGLFGKTTYSDYILRINTRIDQDEQELEDTIIHEMIHYYILSNGIKDTSSHGKIFRKMMAEINEKYGRHITISHKLSEEQRAQATTVKPKTRTIAVIQFKDGHFGVKVLPNTDKSIRYYCRHVRRDPDVASITLHQSRDPFWGRYPASRALRYHPITPSDLTAHLDPA